MSAFEQLCQHDRETALLASMEGLLTWDERTYMPPEAGAWRADQLAWLSGQIHARATDPRVREWLEQIAASPDARDPQSDVGAVLRWRKRQYDKKTRLPQALVEELARASSLGQQVWVEARKQNNFALFLPRLEKNIALAKEVAQAYGYATSPYDALLDDYEPDAQAAEVGQVFAALRAELAPLAAAIAASPRRPKSDILERRFPVAAQETFGKLAAAAVGFDFTRGRLDVTAHPFCGGAGPKDVRITTRYNEHHFNESFFGVLHEAGHGMYEQGLPAEWYGLPPGEAISLGIHESQSRMWENNVGRGLGFWKHFHPQAQRAFPEALADVALEDFYFAINEVKPSLIRVEADEATYGLHIIARFELEQALINDDFPPRELPDAWRQKYREGLGVEPPTDALGVLQDVHWSSGLLGYFPTYALGNLYAAQFFDQAEAELGDLQAQFARGEFAALLGWLRQKIHRHGRRYSASELVKHVTGKPLSHQPFTRRLRDKLAPLYGL